MENSTLLTKARECLREGSLDEVELARRVYGFAGTAVPWVSLLRTLLGASSEFERDHLGRWHLAREGAEAEPLAVAARATRARGGRLLELIAAPVLTLSPVWRWSFRPEGGVRGADELSQVADPVPSFPDLAEEVCGVLQGRPLVVLNSADVSAVRHELELAGLPPLRNRMYELGEALMPEDRKLHRAELRQAHGLAASADPLFGELELCGAIWRRAHVDPGATPADDVARRQMRRCAAELSERPGVYRFLASTGEALYIGSAANVRRRVMSYFAGRVDRTRDLFGLLEHTAELEVTYAATHLDALLIEAEEIAAHSPRYNVQRAAGTQPTWLRLAGGEGSAVRLTQKPHRDDAVYLGPIENRRLASVIADLLEGLWGCTRRGGKRSDVSRADAEALAALLLDTQEFVRQARSRIYRMSSSLRRADTARLSDAVTFVEGYAETGIAVDADLWRSSAVVVERQGETGDVFMTLVNGLRPAAGIRAYGADRRTLSSALSRLRRADAAQGLSGYEMLVRRWLRSNPGKWCGVSSGMDSDSIAAQIEQMLNRTEAAEVQGLERPEY